MSKFVVDCYKLMKYITLLSFLFVLVGCNSDSPSNVPPPVDVVEEHPMRKQVMHVHDEAMKHMVAMKKMKKQLRDPSNVQGQAKTDVMEAISQLSLGDSLMMQWMHEYKEPAEPEALEAFYQSEMTKIKRVEKVINESMDLAKKLLNQ